MKKVSKAVSSALRVYDAFARYGGEEFIIMLRTTTLELGVMIAERIRKQIEALEIVFDEQKIPVTISVGVTQLHLDQMMTAEDLLQRADENLYKAKANGRNCVVS
ncbi:MAG: GGDEF domain-containing protein [Bdellovibrionota bacterium]